MLAVFHFVFFVCFTGAHSSMEGFVVNGGKTPIEKYPHSAFLEMSCDGHWICGSSIINQHFILTAAHCVADCPKSGHISVVVGNTNRKNGFRTAGVKFMAHSKYNEETMESDIGLVMVKTPLPLQKDIKRVNILKIQPTNTANLYIAGWGLIDEDRGISSSVLVEARQTLVPRENCSRVIQRLPQGFICTRGSGYAARGDSGSALVVDGYIQIGLVSFKLNGVKNLVAFTDVCYYYDWIRNRTREMYCD